MGDVILIEILQILPQTPATIKKLLASPSKRLQALAVNSKRFLMRDVVRVYPTFFEQPFWKDNLMRHMEDQVVPEFGPGRYIIQTGRGKKYRKLYDGFFGASPNVEGKLK